MKVEVLRNLINMAELGYRQSVKDGKHQGFLNEDKKTLNEATSYLHKLENPKTAETVLKKARDRNQPVFVLVGQDAAALAALNGYISECTHLDCSDEHLNEVYSIQEDFIIFKKTNPEKMKRAD